VHRLTTKVQYISCDGPWQVTDAGKWHRLFVTADDDEVFMTRSLNVTPKTQQHLIECSGKPEAAVTNKALMKDCAQGINTLEANY